MEPLFCHSSIKRIIQYKSKQIYTKILVILGGVTMQKIRILYIEDDLTAAEYLVAFLNEHGFDVLHTDSIVSAHSYINTEIFDLVLLDLNMPDYSGFNLLKTINAFTLPVIIISAFSDTTTKVKAFRYGVCDYLVKPIDILELEARIWSHLSRCGKMNQPVQKNSSPLTFENGQIRLHNKPVSLTPIESDIFAMLYRYKNHTVARENLTSLLTGTASHRTLDYHIRNIRIKLGDNHKHPRYLKTEYGMGYKLIL